MKNILLTCILCSFLNLKSQQSFTAAVNNAGDARVEFNATTEIKNLVLLIYNKGGETILFESRAEFSGMYQKTISLKPHGSGQYFVRLVRDGEIDQASLTVE